MSFSMVKSAGGADHYFMETDNYYLQSDEYADRFQWWGSGAQKLGLTGKIEREAFLNALSGKLPNGAEIPGSVNGKRRPGLDITFSAPKSVSILALIYKKDELIKAHQAAVTEALTVIQEEAAQARVYGEDGAKIELTKNLMVAQFLHDTSRELDPNLHTHSVIINATERSDGEWRALASNTAKNEEELKGFSEQIFNNQIYYSTIYRASLAKKLTDLGYEIEQLPESEEGSKHGMYEIKGFPQELKEQFSKRRGQIEKLIEAQIEESGVASAKTKDFFTLSSRKSKESVDRTVLHEKWDGDIQSGAFADFNPDSLLHAKSQPAPQAGSVFAREAVLEATRHFGESQLIFTNQDLATKSLQFTMGKASFTEINSAIKELRQDKILVSLSETEMTTKDILTFETEILAKIANVVKGGTKAEVNESVLDKIDATDRQKHIVSELLTAKNGVSLVNVDSYEQPEKFIEAMLNLAEHSGQRVKVLTPTKTYASELEKSVKRESFSAWKWIVNVLNKSNVTETVRGYIYHNENKEPDFLTRVFESKGKDILIVDAGHRLGHQDLDSLLNIAETKQAKLIILNADEGLRGGAAGSPIELLRKANVKELDLAENKSSHSAAKTAIFEIKDDKARAEFIAQKYVEMDEAGQRETHVLAHTNKQADFLNAAIRNGLKSKGQLSQNELTIRTLTPVFLTSAEKKFATQYENDMVLKRFNKGGVEQYLVLKYLQEDNTVLLLNEKQEKIFWNPEKSNWKTALFRKGEFGIVEGDRLLATDNMRHLGIEGGNKLKVGELRAKNVEFLNESTGEISKLKDSNFKYAYATTILGAARERRENAILDIKGFAAKQEVINELRSRATHSIDILTDNQEKLAIQVEKAQLKATTTDTLMTKQSEIPELKKFIDQGTIKNFEQDFDQIAGLLCEKFKGVEQRTIVQQSLDYVLSKLTEREAAFKHADLVTDALNFAMSEQVTSGSPEIITHADIKKELQQYQEEGRLHPSRFGTYWVTKEALDCEKEIVERSKNGRGSVDSLLTKEDAFSKLAETNLTRGQKNAAYSILTTKDRYMVISGDPGTGKTSMVSKVKEIIGNVEPVLKDQGYVIRGVAPTYQAVKEMEAIGLTSQTLKSFVTEHGDLMQKDPKDRPDYSKTLFILDEYSMVSNDDARDFKVIVDACKGRCAYLGDTKQYEAVPAGRPMHVEIQAGIKMVPMEELVRQKNEDALGIAKAAIKGNLPKVFAATQKMNAKSYIERDENRMTDSEKLSLEQSIHEVSAGNIEGLAHACAREYVLRTPDVREKSPIIVQTHRNRELINGLIRNELKDNGELPVEGGVTINRLVRVDSLKADIQKANLPGATHIRLGSDYYKIIEADQKNKALKLRDEHGKIKAVDTGRDLLKYKGNYEAFRLETNEIVHNELIMLRKNDPQKGHRANVNYIVKAIDGEKVLLQHQQDGSEVTLDSSMLSDAHWDYAYTKTGYSLQGASAKYPMVFLPSSDEKLANLRSTCIAFTRHNDHCMIFTDNREEVIRKFSRPQDKLSALEVMGQLDANLHKQEASEKSSHAKVNPSQAKDNTDSKPKPKQEKTQKTYESFDAKDIEIRLANQVETIAEHLLGQRNQKASSGHEWRYGKKGSMSIKLNGEHRGKWHNFETGEGGNLLSLIQQELGLDFKDALRYGANLVGGGRIEAVSRTATQKVDIKTPDQKAEWKLKEIERIYSESTAVEGTLAERYLKEHRAISKVNGASIRFHPNVYSHKEDVPGKKETSIFHPALIAFGINEEGKPTGMQAIYLDETTAAKRKDVPIDKRSFGQIKAAPAIVAKGKGDDRISIIAEGLETAMSIREAISDKHEVLAVLGKENYKNLDPNRLAKIILLVMDNDLHDTLLTGKAIKAAIEKLEKADKEVHIILPKELAGKGKTDLNDHLKKGGKDAVMKELSAHLSKDQVLKKIDDLEAMKVKAGRVMKGSIEEQRLQKLSKNELDKLLDTKKPSQLLKDKIQTPVQKIKQIQDREIG